MSSSNKVIFSSKREDLTVGENSDFTRLRDRSPELNVALTYTESDERRDDAMVGDIILTDGDGGGTFGTKFHANTYDELIEETMRNTWGPVVMIQTNMDTPGGTGGTDQIGTLSWVAPTTNPQTTNWKIRGGTVGTATWTWGNLGFKVGDHVQIFYASDEIQNGAQPKNTQIKTLDPAGGVADYIETSITPEQGTAINLVENDTLDAVVAGSAIENGIVEYERAFHLYYSDVSTDEYQLWRKQRMSQMNVLSSRDDGLVNVTWGCVGGAAEVSDDNNFSGGVGPITAEDATTTPAFNAVTDIKLVTEDFRELSARAFNIDITNFVEPEKDMGRLDALDNVVGTFRVSGDFRLYLRDNNSNIFRKYVENIYTSIGMTVEDVSREGYAFYIPNVKGDNADRAVGATDTPVFLNYPFRASIDPVSEKMMRIQRFRSSDYTEIPDTP